jgi:2-polyprenyl-6-hydroxyphenyl methylase/3-demethylubiquinone-9 3-methyltransferase
MAELLKIWGMSVPVSVLRTKDLEYLKNLPSVLPTLEWVWSEMDRVWKELGLDNKKPLSGQPISEYYNHPVWLMNGFFTACDPLSVLHRVSIASYISTLKVSTAADYGGGFGELALQITKKCPNTVVSVIEPYPSQLGMERTKTEPRISYVPTLDIDYDVVIAQDVLEHVEDPVGLAHKINSSLRKGGLGIYANCFYPVIKCHLPANFFLRDAFPWVMMAMGMHFVGYVNDAPHALIFERTGNLNLNLARLFEHFFKLWFLLKTYLRRFIPPLMRKLIR